MSTESDRPRLSTLQRSVYAVILIIAAGWLLWVGQSILMPIFIAAISVYILVTASDLLGKVPLIRALPEIVRRLLVLVMFVLAVVGLTLVVISAVGELVQKAPTYQANIQSLLNTVTTWAGTKVELDWNAIREATVDRLDIANLLGQAFGGISAVLGGLFMVIIYAIFLIGERVGFARKLAAAMDRDDAEATHRVIGGVNQRIGRYLAIKTLVNVILAVCCFVLLLGFGVDMALFWALVIGLLNYIPYVGAFIGAVLPIFMTLVQFGSVNRTITFAILLVAIQSVVGNYLEPRMVGKTMNMSAFVVLVSLTVWSALWGIPGAILAIPMTSIIMIICGSFANTRPIAIMLCQDVSEFSKIPLAMERPGK